MVATTLVTERFLELARATYESREVPDGPLVLLPRTEQTEYSDPATMTRIVDEAFTVFVRSMVAPAGAPASRPS